ncbi:MAG: hypothetical protein P4M08_09605 [Oligoflexia bacterium]|nr:hypothetical protein [Oligoflexia bacterium]
MTKYRTSLAVFSFLSLASTVTLMTLTAGCSTSGGKQESVVNNASASSDIKGSVSDVNSRTQNVFKDMGISVTGSQTKASGKEQDLTGKTGDKTVTVAMNEVSAGVTHVQVTAKEGALQWNEDYARSVLSKLIEAS